MDSFNDNHTVDLYIYDLTQGMARVMSQMILGRFRCKFCTITEKWRKFSFFSIWLSGRVLDGVWHTAVVVYGREYFFGSQGIQSCPPVSVSTKEVDIKIDRVKKWSERRIAWLKWAWVWVRKIDAFKVLVLDNARFNLNQISEKFSLLHVCPSCTLMCLSYLSGAYNWIKRCVKWKFNLYFKIDDVT